MKQTRNLEDLLRQYDLLAAPAARDAAVTGICNDSRRARDGDLFICKGYGFKPEYLAMARSRGAVCALAETDFPGVDIPCIRVTDVRKAQSLAARWFYDNPSDSLTLIGVTGTKGKTTTSYMIQAVTSALAGRTTGLSSSAGRYCGGPDVDTHLTTPESLDLQWLFAQARDHGLPYMTAEVSSQAYQVERVYGEHFDIPAPEELVFVSWVPGGEVFRSGCCWHRGQGRIFYFQPGHETYPAYYDANVQKVIRQAVRWAYRPVSWTRLKDTHTTRLPDISTGKK